MRNLMTICVLLAMVCPSYGQVSWSFDAPKKANWDFSEKKTARYADWKNGPGVLFVGCKHRSISGLFTCWEPSFKGVNGNGIVVSDGELWLATLPCGATDAEIKAKLEVRRTTADPFRVIQQARASNC